MPVMVGNFCLRIPADSVNSKIDCQIRVWSPVTHPDHADMATKRKKLWFGIQNFWVWTSNGHKPLSVDQNVFLLLRIGSGLTGTDVSCSNYLVSNTIDINVGFQGVANTGNQEPVFDNLFQETRVHFRLKAKMAPFGLSIIQQISTHFILQWLNVSSTLLTFRIDKQPSTVITAPYGCDISHSIASAKFQEEYFVR